MISRARAAFANINTLQSYTSSSCLFCTDVSCKCHCAFQTSLCNTAIDNPTYRSRERFIESVLDFLETDTILWEARVLPRTFLWCHDILLSLLTDINSMNRKSYTTCNKSDGCLWLITQTLSECGADEVDCRLLTFASRHVLQLERCWWSEMCWRYEVRLTPTTGIGVPDISSGDKEKIRQYLNSHAKWTLTGMTHPPPFSHNSIM